MNIAPVIGTVLAAIGGFSLVVSAAMVPGDTYINPNHVEIQRLYSLPEATTPKVMTREEMFVPIPEHGSDYKEPLQELPAAARFMNQPLLGEAQAALTMREEINMRLLMGDRETMENLLVPFHMTCESLWAHFHKRCGYPGSLSGQAPSVIPGH